MKPNEDKKSLNPDRAGNRSFSENDQNSDKTRYSTTEEAVSEKVQKAFESLRALRGC